MAERAPRIMNAFDGVEVLLVEDNEQDADLIMLAFKKGKLLNKLFWVKDGVEAMDFVGATGAYDRRDVREVPRLILLDMTMPRMDGLDVLRALKADAKTRAIPVVVMTVSNQERDLTDCYALGANGFVTKPIGLKELTDAVSKIGMYWLLVNRQP
jgi:two-component system response regulator